MGWARWPCACAVLEACGAGRASLGARPGGEKGELIITHLTGTTPIDRPVYRETLDVAGWTWEPGDHEHREHTAGNLEHARARRRWESGKQNGSLATHASFRFARQSCKAEVGGRAMDVDGGDLLSWLSAVGQEACWEGVM